MHHIFARTMFLCLCVALFTSCTEEPVEVSARVCGDVEVPGTIDSLRVSVLDAKRNELRAGVRDLLVCPEDTLRTLPEVVSFVGVDAQDAWVVVQGLSKEVEVMRYERRVDLSADQTELVTLALTKACVGIKCPLGQTCKEGECQIVDESGPDPGLCDLAPAVEMEMMPEEPEEGEEPEKKPTRCEEKEGLF